MSESTYNQPCVKVYHKDGEWTVWLEPEPEDIHFGLCIGVGSLRQQALADAVAALERALTQIQDGRVT